MVIDISKKNTFFMAIMRDYFVGLGYIGLSTAIKHQKAIQNIVRIIPLQVIAGRWVFNKY